MVKRSFLCMLALCCFWIHSVAQSKSEHKSIRLIPNGSGGYTAIDLVDTLSTVARLNKKLEALSAAFYPIADSLLTFPDSDRPEDHYSGSMRNSFSQRNDLNLSYYFRPDSYTGVALGSLMKETNDLVALIPRTDTEKRDSIIDNEYRRYITSQMMRNVLSNGDSCFSKAEAMVHANYDKSMLNADSVAIIQYVVPNYGTCAVGLSRVIIFYKKNIGYILLYYGLGGDMNRKISFDEASNLIDSLIKQTWGIIRFNDD